MEIDMNWDALGAIAELIGAIAVLVTLVFLTLQLRYANVLASSGASTAQATRLADRLLRVAESQEFALLLAKDWTSSDLSDAEKKQITYYVAMLIHSTGDAYNQWRLGVIEETSFVATLNSLKTGIMQNHTAKSVWGINKRTYGRDFAEKFEKAIYPEGFSTKPEENFLYKESS